MISLGPYNFTDTDALRTLGNLDGLWNSMMLGCSSAAADAIGAALARQLDALVRNAGHTDPGTSLAELGSAAATTLDGSPSLRDALDMVWTSLHAAAEALRSDGQLPARAEGLVSQLSSSKGGVPKIALESVEVNFSGVVGDVQGSRHHHGRPWQALCLYSDEVIDAFRAQGHSIARGSAGENISISGLQWEHLRPGVCLQVGSVVADVRAYATPCRHNAQWFSDRDFNHMSITRGPVSRVYASVREPGRITTGDTVILEP